MPHRRYRSPESNIDKVGPCETWPKLVVDNSPAHAYPGPTLWQSFVLRLREFMRALHRLVFGITYEEYEHERVQRSWRARADAKRAQREPHDTGLWHSDQYPYSDGDDPPNVA